MHNKAGRGNGLRDVKCLSLFSSLHLLQARKHGKVSCRMETRGQKILCALTYDECQVEIIKSFPVYMRVLVIFSPSESNGPENVSFIHT